MKICRSERAVCQQGGSYVLCRVTFGLMYTSCPTVKPQPVTCVHGLKETTRGPQPRDPSSTFGRTIGSLQRRYLALFLVQQRPRQLVTSTNDPLRLPLKSDSRLGKSIHTTIIFDHFSFVAFHIPPFRSTRSFCHSASAAGKYCLTLCPFKKSPNSPSNSPPLQK